MKKSLFLLIALFFLVNTNTINAQRIKNSDYTPKKNLVKVNLTSILLRSYSGQYERVLNKRISVAISYSKMPEGNIPYSITNS